MNPSEKLSLPLDPKRVKRIDGADYLETHDVIRVANEIFGFEGWSHEITDISHIGTVTVKSREGKEGFHTAYRCTVRVTAMGVSHDGASYGDGQAYGDRAQNTTHELALKAAESGAIKRALKNFGDQFGLVLYAGKGAPSVRSAPVQAAQPPGFKGWKDGDRTASQDEVGSFLAVATKISGEVHDTALNAVGEHRAKTLPHKPEGEVSADWLGKTMAAMMRKHPVTKSVDEEKATNEAVLAATSPEKEETPPTQQVDSPTYEVDPADVEGAFPEAA
jgi:hypothetical protein